MYKSYVDETKKELRKRQERALEVVGRYITSEVVKNINKQNLVDTGRLKGSYTHEVDLKELVVTNGTNVEYAPPLEFGTMDGKRKERPHLRPAYYENTKTIKQLIAREMKE